MEARLKEQLIAAGYESGFGLEELIEACGEDFGALYGVGSDKSWLAESHLYYDGDGAQIQKGEGATPTEAVARLWLELNKK